MKRVVSVWLPFLATEMFCRRNGTDRRFPMAGLDGGRRLRMVNPAARAAGLRPGLSLADAQAMVPGLRALPPDPAGERAFLERLAEWCLRYTPWAAVESAGETSAGGGLWLDITGAAHLMGGEESLLADFRQRLAQGGLTCRLAIADTPGAAWAWARFGKAGILPSGRQEDWLADLPLEALRLPADMLAGLRRLGLRKVASLSAMPRAGLAARFGPQIASRLDQALGRRDEPISPIRPVPAFIRRLAFPEPIGRSEDVEAGLRHLLGLLCRDLETHRLGVRRLELMVFCVDANFSRLVIGTGRPERDVAHLLRLFGEPLAGLDAGFGIETMVLSVLQSEPLAPRQIGAGEDGPETVAHLLDTLGNRLGAQALYRFAPQASHLPETHAGRKAATDRADVPIGDGGWMAAPRPLRLFARPEAVEAMAPLPDAPPLLFRWRGQSHALRRAEGPERLAGEWWRSAARVRDYYRVEDSAGRRFWLFREGLYGEEPAPRWFLHGIFP